MEAFDVVVVGQGYAGLCAARLACEQGKRVATFEGVMAGGAVMTVLRLDPSPEAFTRSGPDLGALLGMQNMDLGVRVFFDPVLELRPHANGGWLVGAPNGDVFARHVVFATGTVRRELGVPGEQRFAGNGLSHCADCDGPRVVGRDCVVVGGGDAAFQEAAVLAAYARSVTILMRGSEPRARADLVEGALQGPLPNSRVRLVCNSRVEEILGADDTGVTGIHYVVAGEGSYVTACAGVFVLAGGIPDTRIVPSELISAADGGIVTDAGGAASIPGLWAVGSVRAGFRGGLAEAGQDAHRAVAALVHEDKRMLDTIKVRIPNDIAA
jgi:thioredoxin reductase (NADPH)